MSSHHDGSTRPRIDVLVRPAAKTSAFDRFRTVVETFVSHRRANLGARKASADVTGGGDPGNPRRVSMAWLGGVVGFASLISFFVGVQISKQQDLAGPSTPSAGTVQPLATLPLLGGPGSSSVPVDLPGTSSPAAGSGASTGSATSVGGIVRGSGSAGGGAPSAPGAPGASVATIAVHAAGAVTNPAVYNLAAGARVDDVIGAAGGLRSDADTDAINLAAHVGDGERVFVPRKGQPVPPIQIGLGSPTANGPEPSSNESGRLGAVKPIINLNTATTAELDTLPGVGPSTAEKIIDFRTRVGQFKNVSQLLEVPGIGDTKFAALRSRVRV
jgi:competence protein ComEA